MKLTKILNQPNPDNQAGNETKSRGPKFYWNLSLVLVTPTLSSDKSTLASSERAYKLNGPRSGHILKSRTLAIIGRSAIQCERDLQFNARAPLQGRESGIEVAFPSIVPVLLTSILHPFLKSRRRHDVEIAM